MRVLGTTQCNITSRFIGRPIDPVNPVLFNTIVERLPVSALPSHDIDTQCTPGADENYAIPSSIDMLLEVDVYRYIPRDPLSAYRVEQPFVLSTIFRSALIGPVNGIGISMTCGASLLSTVPPLDVLVQRFWGN